MTTAVVILFVAFACFGLTQGWAFWPAYNLAAVAATLSIWLTGGKWWVLLPVLAAFGLFFFVREMPPDYGRSLASGAIYIVLGVVVATLGAKTGGFAYLCAGVIYPLGLLVDLKVEYLGIVPVISDIFGICALLLIALESDGLRIPGSGHDIRGAGGVLGVRSEALASRETTASPPSRQD